jgi:hypothetical protein
MSAQARLRFLAVIVAVILASRGQPQTETATWTGTTGNWTNPGIWVTTPDTGLFPNNGQPTAATVYNVLVNNGSGVITLNTNITVNQLGFSTGTISGPSSGGPNTLALNQNLAWSGGTISGAINVQAAGGATIAPSTGQTVTLDTGTLNLGGPSSTWSTGNITLLNGATFAVSSADAFTASGDGQLIAGPGGAASAFTNAGLFIKSGGAGTTTVGPATQNNGVIQGQTGVLQFTGQVTNSGTLFASGGVVQLTGPLTNLSGGVLTGGTYRSQSTLALAAGSTISTISANTTVQLDGVNSTFTAVNPVGTINGTFRLTNGRAFTTAGDLTTSGTLDVDTASLLGVNGKLTIPSGGAASIINGMVSVAGTTTVGGTLNVGSGATLSGTQLLTVSSGGKLAVQGTVTQPVTVSNNGILTGNAHFTHDVTIQPGGHLQPGNSPGTVVVGGNMTLNGNYDWDLNGNDSVAAGGTFDQVGVTGSTKLDPPAVNVAFGPALSFSNAFWQTPETWDILNTGSFTSNTVLPDITTDGSFLSTFPNGVFTLSLTSTSLNVNWYPQGVPEPGSCALVGLAAAAWAVRRFSGKRHRSGTAPGQECGGAAPVRL